MSDQKYTIEQIEAALSPCGKCGSAPSIKASEIRKKGTFYDCECQDCYYHVGLCPDIMDAASMWEISRTATRRELLHIAAELVKARIKHPHFVPRLTSEADHIVAEKSLAMMRQHLESTRGNEDAVNVLVCEIAEAVVEIVRGNTEAALVELAQAGAVIVRMMEMVKREMEGGK